MRKVLLILFIALTYTSLQGQTYWIKQTVPTKKRFQVCSFLDSLRGWAAGDSGIIVKTINGGINWNIQESRIPQNINSLYFLNERLGWGLAWIVSLSPRQTYGTIILNTTNGGDNWNSVFYPVENSFQNSILFLDSLNGFIGGYPTPIIRTTNGGLNWYAISYDTSGPSGFPVKNITFYNNRVGFASGGFFDLAGIIYRTTDYGITWKGYGVAPEPIIKIITIDSLKIVGLGGDYEFGPSLVTSFNGGNNWSYMTLLYWGVPTSAAFRTKAEGWAPLGYYPKFLVTDDSAKSWTDMITPDSSFIFDISFPDSRNGFCVGDSGAIYKFNYAAVNVIHNNEQIVPADYKLFQNYPNPFNPVTHIRFRVPNPGFVTIKIYNILGKEITVLVNDKYEPGEYNIQFDGSGFSSGIYYYRMTSGNYTATNTMVLIK